MTDLGWRCLSYCLMTNHVHLVVQTLHADLALGMRLAHRAYAVSFNARHKRVDHVFGDRYGSSLLRDTQHFRRIAAYVAMNPVEAGLCRAASDWRWSSTSAILGLSEPPSWLDVDATLEWFTEPNVPPRTTFAATLVPGALECG